MQIPLRNRQREVVSEASVSEADFEKVSKHCWHLGTNLYVHGYVNGCNVSLHAFIMGPTPPEMIIDHIDNDRQNNLRENLRFLSRSGNSQNVQKRQGMTSIYKGVSLEPVRLHRSPSTKRKWIAHFQKTIGKFESEEEAGRAYDKAVLQKLGAGARTNGLLTSEEVQCELAHSDDAQQPVSRALPKGVTLHHGKYVARMEIAHKTTVIGRFATIQEAAECYQHKRQEFDRLKEQARLDQDITRTEDGVAKITMSNSSEPVLVDDEDWFELQKSKWSKNPGGYAIAMIASKVTLMHRLLLPGLPMIDHINQQKLDNRKSNLRLTNSSENGQNIPKRLSTSKFRGVFANGNRWRAAIRKKRLYYLGLYNTQEEAALAYNAKAIELFDAPCLNVL